MQLVNDERVYFGELSLNTGSYFIYHRTIITGSSGDLFEARRIIRGPRLCCHEVGYSRLWRLRLALSEVNKPRILRALVYEQHSSAYALPRTGGYSYSEQANWKEIHMYAVIVSGGKQHRVEEGEVLKLEKLEVATGESVEFDQVLMVGEGADVKIGAPCC